MQRFDMTFDAALDDVDMSAKSILNIAHFPDVLLFIYESRSMDDPQTVAGLSGFLDIPMPEDTIRKIFSDYKPERVKAAIAALEEKGQIPPDRPNKEAMDTATQWHRGHVGDGAIGKFRSGLTPEQQTSIETRLADLIHRFGYTPHTE